MRIIEEGSEKIGLYEDAVGSKLSYEFEKIVQDVATLLNSRKVQFLAESACMLN